MSAAQVALGPVAPPVPAEVTDRFRECAKDVDQGRGDLRDGLRWLGSRGLLGGGLDTRVALIEAIAGECMSSAFSLWAQGMVIDYLDRGGVDDALAGSLRLGETVGVTAMAPALRDVAGIEPVPVVGTWLPDGGVRLDGPIRWASNLFPGALVVSPVRFDDGGRAIVRFRLSAEGVHVKASPRLLALDSTASSSVTLEGVHIPAGDVLTTDLTGFVTAVRPAFLLTQTAFCAGLAARAAAGAEQHSTGLNAELRPDIDDVLAGVVSVRSRLHTWASAPGEAGPADLLRLRLEASAAATDATRLEATTRGGAGYVATSDVSRRLREAAFLPIQSPTEGQLRWELSRYA
ncbi:acyl-CoA dehydrogenase family protein [Pseudonocardia sp. N23]|uniref:acyl-CoA dehydrogenase family protein n=1 Tax=Pseudonocardia sp. N23 TaxID=1987376 RepID=UPI000BFE970E|nr:acyl-CoA dehydrogenase family protein [Pseudonocardia sp. N23]GAY08886.1 butyryl-CoA dehydrogenase [Pseudonocardia sp. N23]